MFEDKRVKLMFTPDMKEKFQLASTLVFRWHGVGIFVPVGFKTDLASIPGPVRAFIPKHGKYTLAAIVHDYLYSRKGSLNGKHLTRKECDKVFYDAMIDCGVNKTLAKTMYAGVRAGGWLSW